MVSVVVTEEISLTLVEVSPVASIYCGRQERTIRDIHKSSCAGSPVEPPRFVQSVFANIEAGCWADGILHLVQRHLIRK